MAELNGTALLNDANIRSYYRCESDFTDTKGNNNGSGVNSPTFPAGKYGNCAAFNGSSSYATLGSGAGTWGSDTVGTILCWAYLDSAVANGNDVVMYASDQTATGSFGGRLYFYLLSNGTLYKLAMSQGNNFDANAYSPETDYLISTGVWVHLAMSWNGSVGKFYINGVDTAVNAGSFTGTGWFNAANNGSMACRLGARNYRGSGVSSYFPGKIDDFAIFSRALTQAEITTLYQDGIFTHNTIARGAVNRAGTY